MELRHLRYVVAIAEERSVTRAAARLHMQQPPLSQQLRDLEHELGFSLFDRSRKGVEPTVSGRALLNRGRAAFDELVGRYHPLAASVARRWVAHEELAREVAHEALLAAYLSLDRLRQDASFRSWLHGIVAGLNSG